MLPCQVLQDSSGIIQHLLDRALDLLKIERGKMTLECVSINPFHTVDVAVDIARTAQVPRPDDALAVDVRLTFAPEVPEYIKSDPLRLQQIVVNLVTNAIKFCRLTVLVKVYVEPPSKLCIRYFVVWLGLFATSAGAHRALCTCCAKSRLFHTTGSHGSQGPDFCTPMLF